MGTLGYAAMFEQFAPNDLLECLQHGGGRRASAASWPQITFIPGRRRRGSRPSSGRGWARWARRPAVCASAQASPPPGYRYHPAIIAQAAATLAAMFPGRFYLGIGAGEALNEHIVGALLAGGAGAAGDRWMESIEIIRKLFSGKVIKYRGDHFNVESARLYTLPPAPPPIYIATSGPDQRRAHGTHRRRHHHGRRAGREDADAVGALREGRERGGQESRRRWRRSSSSSSHGPRAARRRWSRRCGSGRMAAWPSPRRISVTRRTSRRWRSSCARRTSRTACSCRPTSDEHVGAHPAFHRSRLRRGLRPQRRPQPGTVHQALRREGDSEAALGVTRVVGS